MTEAHRRPRRDRRGLRRGRAQPHAQPWPAPLQPQWAPQAQAFAAAALQPQLQPAPGQGLQVQFVYAVSVIFISFDRWVRGSLRTSSSVQALCAGGLARA
jgi:hypothetical protein